MPVMQACPEDHPLMIAWKAYQAGEDYANSYKWATVGIEPPPVSDRDPSAFHPNADDYRRYVQGSMWAAFMAGWKAAMTPNSIENKDARGGANGPQT